MRPPIKGFIPNSLLDWEGKICSIVFLAGCNFRCPYCHASHLVLGAHDLERIPLDSVLDYLDARVEWVDGVIVSGGEPTLYEGLEELIDRFRGLGLAVRLDTNGSRPEVLSGLVASGKVQYVALDVKAPLDERYCRAAGCTVDCQAVGRSIDFLLSAPVEYEFRTTVCPGLVGAEEIRVMSERLAGTRRWILQAFRPLNCIDPEYRRLPAVGREELLQLASVARKAVTGVSVRGAGENPS
ncbi:MAG: anaerobic ribonucleoside-triphosphate reductase activating protein [Planctomycetota bacterium]